MWYLFLLYLKKILGIYFATSKCIRYWVLIVQRQFLCEIIDFKGSFPLGEPVCGVCSCLILILSEWSVLGLYDLYVASKSLTFRPQDAVNGIKHPAQCYKLSAYDISRRISAWPYIHELKLALFVLLLFSLIQRINIQWMKLFSVVEKRFW